jgi:hypothetical protein
MIADPLPHASTTLSLTVEPVFMENPCLAMIRKG